MIAFGKQGTHYLTQARFFGEKMVWVFQSGGWGWITNFFCDPMHTLRSSGYTLSGVYISLIYTIPHTNPQVSGGVHTLAKKSCFSRLFGSHPPDYLVISQLDTLLISLTSLLLIKIVDLTKAAMPRQGYTSIFIQNHISMHFKYTMNLIDDL